LSSQEAWKLIVSLSTNPNIYQKILNLDLAPKNSSAMVDWETLIGSTSIYKLLYIFQIFESFMEQGDSSSEGTQKKQYIKIIKEGDDADKVEPELIDLNDIGVSEERSMEEQLVENELRKDWSMKFLKNGGFQYIYKLFMDNKKLLTSVTTKFEKDFISFLFKIIRVFIMAAFSAEKPNLVDTIALVRRHTSVNSETEEKKQDDEKKEI
jgi:hypothetical protein